MDKLILHPTDTSQWHALVNEAQAQRDVSLPEDLESYLVFLLMRFACQPEVASSIVAIDYLSCQQALGSQRIEELRNVGDKCLLFSGLFPGLAERRRVRISYFVDIGQAAYATLARYPTETQAELYAACSQDFVVMMDVLQAMRCYTVEDLGISPISANELWHDCGNESAKEALNSHIDPDTLIIRNDKSK